jgi:hypothetical protein
MVPPSLTKKDLFRALQVRVGWGAFIFPFLYDFSPHCLHFVKEPDFKWTPSWHHNQKSHHRRPYGLWLLSMLGSMNKLSSHPHEGKSVSCFHCVERGILGIGNGSRVWTWLGWWKEHCLIGVSLQRGFAKEPLVEPLNFWVVASGSQQSLTPIEKLW